MKYHLKKHIITQGHYQCLQTIYLYGNELTYWRSGDVIYSP